MGESAVQLGFVSAILPDSSLDEVVRFAMSTGYDCVELMCWPPGGPDRRYGGVTHIDAADFPRRRGGSGAQSDGRRRGRYQRFGLLPQSAFPPDAEEAETAVAHLRKVIDAAKLLGVDRVNTFIGRDWTKSVDDNWPQFEQTWRPMIDYAGERGVRIGIENCPMLFFR